MVPKLSRVTLILITLSLCVPALASGQSARSERIQQIRAAQAKKAASQPNANGNGQGLGRGGVPALRDAVVLIEARTTQLEDDLTSLTGRVGDLETLVEGLGSALDALEATVSGIDGRLAAIEALSTDDDLDGFSEIDGDCDDGDAAVNPLASEIPANSIDDDCDFLIDEI